MTDAPAHVSASLGSFARRVQTHDSSCSGRFREKFIRLQHENKMLRLQQEEHQEEKITALQAQLEESHKTRSELDTENR